MVGSSKGHKRGHAHEHAKRPNNQRRPAAGGGGDSGGSGAPRPKDRIARKRGRSTAHRALPKHHHHHHHHHHQEQQQQQQQPIAVAAEDQERPPRTHWALPDAEVSYSVDHLNARLLAHFPIPPPSQQHEDGAPAAAAAAAAAVVVGLDLEARPAFRKGQVRKVALVQVSSLSAVVLVPVFHLRRLPPHLVALLESPAVWKAGVGVQGDASCLARDFGIQATSLLEVGTIAQAMANEGSLPLRPPPPHGGKMSTIASLRGMLYHLGVHVDKPKRVTLSNWERRPLGSDQQEYAACDAYAGVWGAHELCARALGLDQGGLVDPAALAQWVDGLRYGKH